MRDVMTEIRNAGRDHGAVSELILGELLAEMDVPDFRRVERIVLILRRRGKTNSGFPLIRPDDFVPAIASIRKLIGGYARHIRSKDMEIVTRLERLILNVTESDVHFYPREVLQLKLLQAEMCLIRGDVKWVRDNVGRYADAIYSVEVTFAEASNIMELDCQARLIGAELGELSRLAIARAVTLTRMRLLSSWGNFSKLAPYMAIGSSSAAKGIIAYSLHSLGSRTVTLRRHRHSVFRRAMAKAGERLLVFFGGFLLACRYAVPDVAWFQTSASGPGDSVEKSHRRREVVVTRAMGGIGDLLMMTPGLRALARREKRPVKLLISRKFFAVFENNPDVELIDIDQTNIEITSFRRWYNLTDCPAAAYESRRAPFVKKGRVELFAQGLGIGKWRLSKNGWNIGLTINAEQAAFCAKFLSEHSLGRRPLVGIQPYSRDSYKDHLGIQAIIQSLAEKYDVLLFHHVSDGLPPNFPSTAGLSLGKSLALVSTVDVLVAVDSAFVQAAAGFDVPVVAMFGPTDGALFTKHISRVTVIDHKTKFPCSPCWRNEDLPCAMTGQLSHSPCVTSVSPAEIDKAVASWLLTKVSREARIPG